MTARSRAELTFSPDRAFVEKQMLEQPSGDVRGTVAAYLPTYGGGCRQVAQATLTLNKPVKITLDLYETFSVQELFAAIAVLHEFAFTVRDSENQK